MGEHPGTRSVVADTPPVVARAHAHQVLPCFGTVIVSSFPLSYFAGGAVKLKMPITLSVAGVVDVRWVPRRQAAYPKVNE